MSSREWPRALPPFAPLRGGAVSLGKLRLEVRCILLESGLGGVSLLLCHLWGGGNPQPLTLESGPQKPSLVLLPASSTYSLARVHRALLEGQRMLSGGRNNKG